MTPCAASVPARFALDCTFAAQSPSFRARWVDLERLFRLAVLFAQLTQTEAANHVPRALDSCYCSPHAPRCSLSSGPRGEVRPSDIHFGGPRKVGAAAAQRLPSAKVAVVGSSHVVPGTLVAIHHATAACTCAVATHSRPDADALTSALCKVVGELFLPIRHSHFCGDRGLCRRARRGAVGTFVPQPFGRAGSA